MNRQNINDMYAHQEVTYDLEEGKVFERGNGKQSNFLRWGQFKGWKRNRNSENTSCQQGVEFGIKYR